MGFHAKQCGFKGRVSLFRITLRPTRPYTPRSGYRPDIFSFGLALAARDPVSSWRGAGVSGRAGFDGLGDVCLSGAWCPVLLGPSASFRPWKSGRLEVCGILTGGLGSRPAALFFGLCFLSVGFQHEAQSAGLCPSRLGREFQNAPYQLQDTAHLPLCSGRIQPIAKHASTSLLQIAGIMSTGPEFISFPPKSREVQ